MKYHAILIAICLVGCSQTARAAVCAAPGIYPIKGHRNGVSLEARIVHGKMVGTGFSAEPITNDIQITPLGLSRGMIDDQLFEWDVAYAYRTGAANGIMPTELNVTVLYPATRKEALNLRLSIGARAFMARMHRDPTMPNVSDVYANIPLPASAGGLFHPNEPGTFLVTDAATGAPLLKGAVMFPDGPLVQAALKAAIPGLNTECELAAGGGMQF